MSKRGAALHEQTSWQMIHSNGTLASSQICQNQTWEKRKNCYKEKIISTVVLIKNA